ncbi:MAG: CPBP family intramembrane metalloprotease [Boseongicola sp.]|nr:MAG: CPBP family intramembrane metalloprotease [Boseongicola sp.]
MSYLRFQPMIIDASAKPAPWRLIAGIVTTFIVLAIWVSFIVALAAIQKDLPFQQAFFWMLQAGGETPQSAITILLLVAGLGYGAHVSARMWHGRDLRSLAGAPAVVLRHFFVAVGVSGLVTLVLVGFAISFMADIERNMTFSGWFVWLPAALLALLIQTGSEELLFRGYLQSQLAAISQKPIVWMGLSALAFGLVHYNPGASASERWIVIGYATIFGFLASDLTARTGSIGPAWGFHMINNVSGLLIIAPAAGPSGLGLWRSEAALDDMTLLVPTVFIQLLATILVWWMIRRVIQV